MEFKNERELQTFIRKTLNKNGYRVRDGSALKNGSIPDLVGPGLLIEVKPTLSRSAQLQAYGQIEGLYGQYFPRHRKVIAGLAPSSDRAYKSAKATSKRLKASKGIEVWYVDELDLFLGKRYGKPYNLRILKKHNIPLWISAGIPIATACILLGLALQAPTPPPPRFSTVIQTNPQ